MKTIRREEVIENFPFCSSVMVTYKSPIVMRAVNHFLLVIVLLNLVGYAAFMMFCKNHLN